MKTFTIQVVLLFIAFSAVAQGDKYPAKWTDADGIQCVILTRGMFDTIGNKVKQLDACHDALKVSESSFKAYQAAGNSAKNDIKLSDAEIAGYANMSGTEKRLAINLQQQIDTNKKMQEDYKKVVKLKDDDIHAANRNKRWGYAIGAAGVVASILLRVL